MYGLTHRISTEAHSSPAPGPHRRAGARATVVVIESDPATLVLVERAVAGDYRVVVALDAADALALIDRVRPEVLLFDVGLPESEVAMVTVALAACDHLDSMPSVMLDPHEPMNAPTLRARIDEAVRVSRRVFLGGGLHQRFTTAP